jgi:hypothetical protein
VRAGGGKAETLKAEMLKSEGGRTEDGGRKAGKAETLKAEILKSKGGRQKTEDGRRRAEESGSGRKAETLKTEMLKSAGVRRVIIVTSWYHSRRALHTFQHYAPDMQFYSRPSYYGYPRAQWSRAGISGYIRSEYVKLAGYWVCYGVWPF